MHFIHSFIHCKPVVNSPTLCDISRHKQTDRQTGRQMDRQGDRQLGRGTTSPLERCQHNTIILKVPQGGAREAKES